VFAPVKGEKIEIYDNFLKGEKIEIYDNFLEEKYEAIELDRARRPV
jgi:hypothetical protein